jgi:iron complex outermembrane recepter protein
MNSVKFLSVTASLGCICFGQGSLVFAESVGDNFTFDEIVVTAQKREQNLQDVGLAISALTSDALDARGIESGSDLQFSVPAIAIAQAVVGPSQIVIRGVGMDNVFLGGDPGVPIHVDGHYIQDTNFITLDFLDIERVEVLRGPQGTLYGRNAIGGSVNIITKRPTEEFEALLSADFGNYNKRIFQGVISGAIADGFRVRVAASNGDRDGYIKNVAPGFEGGEFNTRDYTSVRLKAELDVSEDIMITLGGYYLDDKSNFLSPKSNPNPTPLPFFVDWYAGASEPATLTNLRTTNANIDDSAFSFKARGASLDLDWDMGAVVFRSLSAYSDTKRFGISDIDQTAEVTIQDNITRKHETFTQELQLLSGSESKAAWILGLFYYDENASYQEFINWPNFFIPNGPATYLDLPATIKAKAFGAFGQIEYPITKQITVIGGLRYNYDKKDNRSALFIPQLGVDIDVSTEDSWSEITGKLGVNYYVNDDILIYGQYSTGYKAGGFGLAQPSYDPEKITSYEAGVKATFLEGRMQGSLTGFHYVYSNKQELDRDPLTNLAFIKNSGAATVNGLELEAVIRPLDGLTIDTSVALLDAQYTEFLTVDGLNQQLGIQDLSGNQIPRSPKHKVYIGIQYEWAAFSGTMTLRVDSVWSAAQWGYAFNRPDRDFIDSYNRLSSQISWLSGDENWQVTVYMKNIDDGDDVQNAFDGAPTAGTPVGTYSHLFDPRTYGLKVTRNF